MTSQSTDITHIFRKIRTWVANHYPELERSINDPASDLDIARVFKNTGVYPPDDFTLLYKEANGQSEQSVSLFCGYYFMEINSIVEEYQKEMNFIGDPTMDHYAKSYIDNQIIESRIHPGRIYFASDLSGNYLAIDSQPGSSGDIGQIISCGRDEYIMKVVAKNLTDFLTIYCEMLYGGNVFINSDPDLGDRLEVSPTGVLVDDLISFRG